MAFPPGFLDQLRSRVPLGDLVGRRVRLTRRGRAHGDAIGFLMRADNLDFIEAVERLAGEAGIAVPQQTPQDRERAQRQKTLLEALGAAADFYEAQLRAPSGARAREYLTARGLDEETIRRFRLGWASDDRQALRRALAHPRGWRQPLRLFPRPGDVPDRRPRRPGHRLWRADARRRPAEISQLARHPGLRERPRALCLGGG